jgi:hypothetical protein
MSKADNDFLCDEPPFGRKTAVRKKLVQPLCVLCEQDKRRTEIKRAITLWTSNLWALYVCEYHDDVLTRKLTEAGWTIDKQNGDWKKTPESEAS